MKERENKVMETRRQILDELLSDRANEYTWDDLTKKVSDRLNEMGKDEVSRRTIEKDVKYLTDEPYYAEIETVWKTVFVKEKMKHVNKVIVRYADPTFSIYKKQISYEEKNLLREVLNTIGHFDGLDNFAWLHDFKKKLGFDEEQRKIISFSNNPDYLNSLDDPKLLGTLFNLISNKVVIELSYHTFDNTTVRSIDFHPYLLKQYNNRWFLIGADDKDMFILNFALDRIDKVEPLPGRKYEECPDDLEERFSEIIGVTLYNDKPVEHIVFWASNRSKDYVLTKPLHETQKHYTGKNDAEYREKYPSLQEGDFFSIKCRYNYELISVFMSFGKDLLVLSSSQGIVKKEVDKRVREMMEEYDKLRT